MGHTIPDVIMDINPMGLFYILSFLVALVVVIFIAKLLNTKSTNVVNYDS